METNGYNAQACPVGKTITLISGKWKPIILYLIQHGFNRFGMLERKMPDISKKILTAQLRDLEKHGLILRDVRISKHPQEVVYSLTASGHSLRELIEQIFEWGTVNLLDKGSQDRVKSMLL